MEQDFYAHKKSTKLMRLFWKAAGADRYILERSTYGDQIKYVCLGGIIVATGVMAAIAGGYAFYTIFEPKGNAIDSFKTVSGIAGNYDHTDLPTAIKASIFGLIWGAIIFNIDRFIVTSTGKGDGTEAITRKELVGALPRLIMGAIIALTISKPVEIRMFKTEIDVALHEKQIQQQQNYKANIDSIFNGEIKKKELGQERFFKRIHALDSISDVLTSQIGYENSHGGCKGKCLLFIDQRKQNQEEKKTIENDPDFKKVRTELAGLEKERNIKLAESDKVAAGLDGLLERIKLAHEKAGWVISLFVTLLFMTIELTPIFFKLMLIKSPYDYMEENIKELIKANQGIEIIHNFYPDGEGIERDKVINHEVIKMLKEKVRLLETQTQLSDSAMEEWKKQKLNDIRENPSDFITEQV
jgi:TM2 domain-containing membrane protein YozV